MIYTKILIKFVILKMKSFSIFNILNRNFLFKNQVKYFLKTTKISFFDSSYTNVILFFSFLLFSTHDVCFMGKLDEHDQLLITFGKRR